MAPITSHTSNERLAMCSHIFSDMTPRSAVNGGLDHHAMVCSCGYEATSTMPSLVAEYAREHIAWEAGRPAREAKAARKAARVSA